jgi:hypothetical protein
MSRCDEIDVLNRLLRTLCRSLAMYVREARPWTPPGHEAAVAAMGQLAADQEHYVARVAAAIQQCGGRPETGAFPLRFTAINDLSADYLLSALAEHHGRDLLQIEACAAELAGLPELCALAEEIAGNARGHAEILARLLTQTRA